MCVHFGRQKQNAPDTILTILKIPIGNEVGIIWVGLVAHATMNEKRGAIMRNDIIFSHENWQGRPLRAFLAIIAARNGVRLPPPETEVEGEIPALVNHGRWMAHCGCGGAVVVSSKVPLFWCPDCGNQANKGKWLRVIFPAEKEEIEKELLKRPADDGFRARNRNWLPGESVADLAKENSERGIG